ncbi:NAD(P)/FAD-dependent oxidoreductase [Pyxidicoccus xibeiensis]|uniref:NAD(P)/FAD-dependent oxidoreductase n=1 Tax=Pyxidicoccus xibeiensis TaxID=2906759 RepID=UPI0020A7094F|nr:FAD-dependent oxidoreductase [Pyxidicoccus xibeiensis]MCP3144727.1 FAD-dependent oxidoreductase [Pyxidicoccus xibeiensis]
MASFTSPLDTLLPKRSGPRPRVAVIGAGISGVALARALHSAGYPVQVFEKSRGAGGRMATRRTEDGGAFDHGAQYFTARDALFQEQVRRWMDAGLAAEWNGVIGTLEHGRVTRSEREHTRYVGVPGMGAGVKQLAEELALHREVRVERLEREGPAWRLFAESGPVPGVFDVVVAAVPAPQAVPLLAGAPGLAARAGSVRMQPCLAVMARFASSVELEVDAAFVHGSPLSWIAREEGKPGRRTVHPGEERWVLHGSPEASREALEDAPEQVATRWVEAFAAATGRDMRPVEAVAHRWRYALPAPAREESFLFDAASGLGACGDWCGGPRVEGAFLSGVALARHLHSR